MASFHTNCSLPSTPTYFVVSPNARGTLDILWSSLSAMLLCTWSIQHLNVPPQRRAHNWLQKLKRMLVGLYWRIFWMIVTAVAPEVLIGTAAVELVSARASAREMEKLASKDSVPWSVTHAYFANMGGFVIRFAARTTSDTSR